MSDEVAKQFAEESKPPVEPAGRSVTLSATLHPNGQVEFSIPKNKIVAGGLIQMLQTECAKLEVLHTIATNQQAALKSRGGMNGLLKRMNGG